MRKLLAILPILLLDLVLSAEKKDVINYNWQELFTEPFEIVYVIMKDGETFNRTQNYEDAVIMDAGRLKKALKKKRYEIKDIAIVIHNHLTVCRFSDEDHKRYRRLKKYGFDGLFLVYCHTSKKTYDIEGGIKKRASPPFLVQILSLSSWYGPGFRRPSRLPPEKNQSMSRSSIVLVTFLNSLAQSCELLLSSTLTSSNLMLT